MNERIDSPRAAGRAHRKQIARGDLAHWDPKLRHHDPLHLLDQAMRGRVPELLKIKNQRMASCAFSFFRGALPIMAYDLSLTPHTAIANQICGDAHVENLGAFAGDDGRLTFDINDFDETTRAPFEWDLKRMTTSILLAAREANFKPAERNAAALRFLRAYMDLTHTLTTMPVLSVARYKVHGLEHRGPVADVLALAARATPERTLTRLTHALDKEPHRMFRSQAPLLRRVLGEERTEVLHSLKTYRETLAPERQHFIDLLRPVDVAFKVVGTGSVGLRDYCVWMQGNGPTDAVFLQIKEEVASAVAPYVPKALRAEHAYKDHGERVVNGQRAMQYQSDPLLGWTKIHGRHFLVRQLSDHKATLDVTTLKPEPLNAYVEVCGRILAHGHARSGDVHRIAGYIGKGEAFPTAILAYATAYAKQTVADWKALVASMKQ